MWTFVAAHRRFVREKEVAIITLDDLHDEVTAVLKNKALLSSAVIAKCYAAVDDAQGYITDRMSLAKFKAFLAYRVFLMLTWRECSVGVIEEWYERVVNENELPTHFKLLAGISFANTCLEEKLWERALAVGSLLERLVVQDPGIAPNNEREQIYRIIKDANEGE